MDVRKSRSIAFLTISYGSVILDVLNSLWIAFGLPFQIVAELFFGGHFGCPKITFDRISGHFRSIRNCFVFLIFDKMAVGGHFGWDDNVNYRTRPRYLMSNACVKFEERSLNPSKVITLTTKF